MTTIFDFADFAEQFNGTTGDLTPKATEHKSKSVEEARSELVERIQEQLQFILDVQNGDAETINGAMVRRIRKGARGYSVKVGYGAKNERFNKDDEPINFADLENVVFYLSEVREQTKNGALDSLLEMKLAELTERAAEARKARKNNEEKKKAA